MLSTQRKALEEIIDLTIEDPVIHRQLAQSRLSHLVPQYEEPDLILSASRALGSIRNAHTHNIWSFTVVHLNALNNVVHSDLIKALIFSLRYGQLLEEL